MRLGKSLRGEGTEEKERKDCMQREKRREKKREGAKCLVYRGRSLSGEAQLLGAKFRVGGRVCQGGTEGCWETRSALLYKYLPESSAPCPGCKTKHLA